MIDNFKRYFKLNAFIIRREICVFIKGENDLIGFVNFHFDNFSNIISTSKKWI